ncbi:MAG: hypothetical protein WCQ47_03715, partial [bacterium]
LTIKAIAVKTGLTDSAIAAATYTLSTSGSSLHVSHFVGSIGGRGSDDGTGSNANFNNPQDITSDGTNLYVADTGNNIIRKIIIATGEVSTFAGSPGQTGSIDAIGSDARFSRPSYITTDGTNLYVVDLVGESSAIIRKIVIATAEVTTLAGSVISEGASLSCNSGVINGISNIAQIFTNNFLALGWGDGIGVNARFFNPKGITTDGTNLYITDSDIHTIRKIEITTATVTTLAGTNGESGSNDGTGVNAKFSYPSGITTDGTNLYVSDTNNLNIRKIVISTGVVTTLAGTAGEIGSLNGTGSNARFYLPNGITTDGTNLYVTDTANRTIRKIEIATATVTTLAGTVEQRGSNDGTGTNAKFWTPYGITTDNDNLYVTDIGNHTVRKIVISTGVVNTLAGEAEESGSLNGTGANARFNYPNGITSDGTNLYVTDSANNTIRKIEIATATVTTLAGTAGASGSNDATGVNARFYYPNGITTDGTNLFVADTGNSTIRKIVISSGEVTTLAGSAGDSGFLDEAGTNAKFNYPYGVTTDGTNLYVADTNNQVVRKIVIANGNVTTLAGSAGENSSIDGTGTNAKFNYPYGITSNGNYLYVTENHTIRKIEISTGMVTTLAGSADFYGWEDGIASNARFARPFGITTDGTNLYVVDNGSNTIRKIVIETTQVTTFSGIVEHKGHKDGTLDLATFSCPNGIIYVAGKLFISEECNNDIRKIE